mmetsp:Transcript_22651/g.58265  ORF Transcript_22651/g.58265 Transcript_22651/m.58265 type:complete len:327 (-) Transcript_22651:464-1444(-)
MSRVRVCHSLGRPTLRTDACCHTWPAAHSSPRTTRHRAESAGRHAIDVWSATPARRRLLRSMESTTCSSSDVSSRTRSSGRVAAPAWAAPVAAATESSRIMYSSGWYSCERRRTRPPSVTNASTHGSQHWKMTPAPGGSRAPSSSSAASSASPRLPKRTVSSRRAESFASSSAASLAIGRVTAISRGVSSAPPSSSYTARYRTPSSMDDATRSCRRCHDSAVAIASDTRPIICAACQSFELLAASAVAASSMSAYAPGKPISSPSTSRAGTSSSANRMQASASALKRLESDAAPRAPEVGEGGEGGEVAMRSPPGMNGTSIRAARE